MSDYKHLCAKLSLYRITKANALEANEHLLKFVDSSDKDGRVPRFRNNTSTSNSIKNSTMNETRYYQIQFETIPGHAQFELTADYHPLNDTFSIRKKRLSRMNKYGQTSSCIAYKRPEFREICYCSNLLNRTQKFDAVLVDAVIDNQKKRIKNFHTVANSSSLPR